MRSGGQASPAPGGGGHRVGDASEATTSSAAAQRLPLPGPATPRVMPDSGCGFSCGPGSGGGTAPPQLQPPPGALSGLSCFFSPLSVRKAGEYTWETARFCQRCASLIWGLSFAGVSVGASITANGGLMYANPIQSIRLRGADHPAAFWGSFGRRQTVSSDTQTGRRMPKRRGQGDGARGRVRGQRRGAGGRRQAGRPRLQPEGAAANGRGGGASRKAPGRVGAAGAAGVEVRGAVLLYEPTFLSLPLRMKVGVGPDGS